MTTTSRGERLHIGIFGNRNAGKSSLINALTRQEIALVSDTPGTTTDPVYKSMEILPLGPAVLIDTAGLDDSGELGEKRVRKSLQVLDKCDFVLVVSDIENSRLEYEKNLISQVQEKKIPLLWVLNKRDLNTGWEAIVRERSQEWNIPVAAVSALTGEGIDSLKRLIIENTDSRWHEPTIVGDIIAPGDVVVLVTPIDDAAPKGRLILPQVQTIRDILDNDAISLVVKERELNQALKKLVVKPKIVITDSQAFQKVSADTPDDVLLTSFSILFARYKGDLLSYLEGIKKIKELKDGDKILIAEACTHHVQSDDIGTVKIPRWLRQLTGKNLLFEKYSGADFPANLGEFALVVHCGACMLNRRETLRRIAVARETGVPITNYGMTIAYSFGILERALKPFPLAQALFDENIY